MSRIIHIFLLLILLCFSVQTASLYAQGTASDGLADETPTAEEEAPAEDAAPSYPAGLDNPEMDIEEFSIRLIPLTKEELDRKSVV